MHAPSPRRPGFSTRAIHVGHDPYAGVGSLNPPVYLSSTFAFPTVEEGAARFAGEQPGYVYSRVGNPTVAVLEQRLADLEGAQAAVVTASGMGAITSLTWTLLSPGDEVVADTTLYGCTFAHLNHGLARFGVRVTHVDMTDLDRLRAVMTPRTRLVYFESPANPNMRLIDIAAVADLARGSGARVVVDNTYCTPYLQRPIELGADFVVHSATKYLGGHGDLIAGVVLGRTDDMQQVRMTGVKDMTGAVLGAHDAYLILRGLKTLSLRMHRHTDNARCIAEFLVRHPRVAAVHYPGLEGFAQHALARRQMALAGGMLAFELEGGFEAARQFMNRLRLVIRAVSLGDAETLAQHPASMTHSFYTPEERQAHLISEGLVRLSAGLEDAEDLIADIAQALEA